MTSIVRLRRAQIPLVALALAGCGYSGNGESTAPNQVFDSLAVSRDVRDAVAAFHHADTTRDAAAVAGLIWPEFSMLADGNRVDYQAAVAGAHAFLPTLRTFHTDWTDLEIMPLSPDLAISSFTFRDSIVTKSGDLTQKQGPNTFVWQRKNGEWRVLYADADHYPIGPVTD
jgi:ketosteroid isomerase-like protein